MMSIESKLYIVFLVFSWMMVTEAFHVSLWNGASSSLPDLKRMRNRKMTVETMVVGTTTSLYMSSDDRPNLIGQSLFREAIETLESEVAKASGAEYVKEEEDSGLAYAIGRLEIPLSIPPAIDLVETPQLVLISGIGAPAQEAGIRPLDTIISVSVADSFHETTKELNLDQTFAIVKAAITHARENDIPEIKFEINRLLSGHYG